jgi:hypothetical protein
VKVFPTNGLGGLLTFGDSLSGTGEAKGIS